jgi:hypothetical protein
MLNGKLGPAPTVAFLTNPDNGGGRGSAERGNEQAAKFRRIRGQGVKVYEVDPAHLDTEVTCNEIARLDHASANGIDTPKTSVQATEVSGVALRLLACTPDTSDTPRER